MCKSCQQLADIVLPTLQMFERRLRQLEAGLPPPSVETAPTNALRTEERNTLIAALAAGGGVQKKAAAVLGISPRVMQYKVKLHGLESYCLLAHRR